MPNLVELKLQNTGLEWIDPNVGQIYAQYSNTPYSSAWISIKNNTNLKCSKDMAWMNTPGSRPKRVHVDGSMCKDEGVLVPLENYLKDIVKENPTKEEDYK